MFQFCKTSINSIINETEIVYEKGDVRHSYIKIAPSLNANSHTN